MTPDDEARDVSSRPASTVHQEQEQQTDTDPASLSTPAPFPPDFPHIPIGHPDTMMSVESVRRAVEEFTVRPTDVIVATFPKTGTTLVTWIAHQLRTGGDLHFETLYDVVPWPLLSWDIGLDPNTAGNEFTPRVFKSHLRMASVYRGCKYVVTVRDPVKVCLSFYNFFLAKQVPIALNMDVDEFVVNTPFVNGRVGRASLWEYYAEYHALRECDSVLVLVYEDLLNEAGMERSIRMLAEFMDLNADDELIAKVASMSTKKYMAQHNNKFDEPYERAKELGRVGNLSELAPGNKVAVKDHPQSLKGDTVTFLNDKWRDVMQPLGYENYEAFADSFREINRNRFGHS